MARKAKVAALERAAELEALDDLGAVKRCFGAAVADFGFEVFSCAGFPRRAEPFAHEVFLDTFPKGFLEGYLANYLKSDPSLFDSLATTWPLTWTEIQSRRAPDRNVRQVFGFFNSFDMNEGINIPLHSSGSYSGLILLGGRNPDLSPESRAAALLLGTYCHSRVIDLKGLLAAKQTPLPSRVLTDRERECISWVAEGKSDWEIGEILKISESTAHFHIENAKRKLGVHTRVQLVVHAMRLGEVLPQA